MNLGVDNPLLGLILALSISIRDLTDLVRLKKYQLSNALPRIDPYRSSSGVGNTQGCVSFPLRLKGSDVDQNPATSIGRLPDAEGQDIPGILKYSNDWASRKDPGAMSQASASNSSKRSSCALLGSSTWEAAPR